FAVIADHHNVLKDEIKALETYLSSNLGTGSHPLSTGNRALESNGSGKIVEATTTATELGYLSGVTSAIQTQINGRLPLSGGTMSGALLINNATCKFSLDGLSTTNQIGSNYDLGTIPNPLNTSITLNLNCPTTNANLGIGVSDTANTLPSIVATFQSAANGGCKFTGTGTNDSAAAGFVGEYGSSLVSTTNLPASTIIGDLTS